MNIMTMILLGVLNTIPVPQDVKPYISEVSPEDSVGIMVVGENPRYTVWFSSTPKVSTWVKWYLDGTKKQEILISSGSVVGWDGVYPADWIPSPGTYVLRVEIGEHPDAVVLDSHEWTIVVVASDEAVIKATAGAYGGIDPSGYVVVTKGTNKTFTITPSAGYIVGDLKIDGSYDYAAAGVAAIGTTDGFVATVPFTNVTANHTVEVTFRPAPAISAFTPGSPVTVKAGNNQVFTVAATDTSPLEYRWYLDGAVVQDGASSYTYSPIAADLGTHELKVRVKHTDGLGGFWGHSRLVWATTVVEPSKSSGGGGGGCSLVANGEDTSPVGWAIPFLAIVGAYILGRVQSTKKGRSI